jgi:hypothetical protein
MSNHFKGWNATILGTCQICDVISPVISDALGLCPNRPDFAQIWKTEPGQVGNHETEYHSLIFYPYLESKPTHSPRALRDYIPLPEYQNNRLHYVAFHI